MASARTSDAEVVERLKALRKHGSQRKAAAALGLGDSTSIHKAVMIGKMRGLTADSVVKDELQDVKARLRDAERALAAQEKENDTAQSIREAIYGLREPHPIPKWTTKAYKRSGHPGIPMTMWSDWHYGEVVRAEEVGGVNEYNIEIADRRIRKLVDKTIYLIDRLGKQKYPGIVVCLGGDMISGDIHEELQDTNAEHVNVCLRMLRAQLIAALSKLADRFGRVYVPCVVGNHGRMTKKPRMKGRVFTSFEWNLYSQLEDYFKAKGDTRLIFNIPGETDAYFQVLGHRFLLTHGDNLGVKGGDGIIGALGPIARGTFKVGRSEAQIGRDFDTLIIGHWHTYIPRSEAVPVIVNGTSKGYDEFARLALRVPYSRPSQALWFVYEEHGIGEQWQVFLEKLKHAPRTNGQEVFA